MYARLRSVIMLWLPVALFFLACTVQAKDKGPSVRRHEFDFQVTDVQYFAQSETVIAHSALTGHVRVSFDGGLEWKEADGIPAKSVRRIYLHPYDNTRAYALGDFERHWYTSDQGKTWSYFQLPPERAPRMKPLSFHAGDEDKVILNVQSQLCAGPICIYESFYTTDNFKNIQILKTGTQGRCVFARSNEQFKVKDDDKNGDLVLCAVKENERSLLPFSQERILTSNDFFKSEGVEPLLDGAKPMKGAFEIATVKGYIVVAQRSEGTSELALYVSDDAFQWDRAEFEPGHKIHENAYTLLESTDYSIQIQVKTFPHLDHMGTILSSNSNGTYFRKNIQYVNRNRAGIVDFEKIQGIDGIYLVNTVKNHEEAAKPLTPINLQTKITFDDGWTFQNLHLVDDDGKKTDEIIHLHSVTELNNQGRVFSSPAAGIVMGIGNTGDELKDPRDSNLYTSDDGGLTWRLGQKKPHKYEFGDQGSLVLAIPDEGTTEKAIYSLNHGRHWEKFDLEHKMWPDILTTVPDSTGLKFILTGIEGTLDKPKSVVYSFDFEDLDVPECQTADFEKWVARKDPDGDPDCLMGHSQIYERRKADSECLVKQKFKKPVVELENCPCTREDFECAYNFRPDDEKNCVPTENLKPPKGSCEGGDDDAKFRATPFRLIPGDTCEKSGGAKLDEEEKDVECKALTAPKGPASGSISTSPMLFGHSEIIQKVYLERAATATGEDETILALDEKGQVYRSRDHGKKWELLDLSDKIELILPHPYNNDMVFLLTSKTHVHYSVNRGKTFDSFKVPAEPIVDRGVAPLSFHVDKDNWMLWIGRRDGYYEAWYSQSRGEEWHALAKYVRKCEFIKRKGWEGGDDLIYCEQHEGEDPSASLQLVSSNDWFASKPNSTFRDIVAFATMSNYVVVANKDSEKHLKIDASTDGEKFAEAKFPQDFKVPDNTAYTLLDSSTSSVFLQVTVSGRPDFEFGRLMKSNSNGTSYVSLIGAVNQDGGGYVDFEKMQGIAGVAMVNVVENFEQKDANEKQLKTWITHNDGANWVLIKDVVDDVGDGFGCSFGKDCSLNLHSYTERLDPRATFSSKSAIGLMVGVGNVGKHLEGEGDTFLTRDGGIQWRRVKKGRYMWKFGDEGSVVVLVQRGSTDVLHYTLDEGSSWQEYKFYDSKVEVSDITTTPSDKSRSFIVWGNVDKQALAVSVDFDGIRDRTCELKEHGSQTDEGDYYLWTPSHPKQDNDCLFGRKTVLHRKKPEANCWNDLKIDPLHSELTENCTCTRRDFECNYNYELTLDNDCRLVPGTEAPDPAQVCKDDPQRVSYYDDQGFRKIPISTCHGNEVGRFFGVERPCPGHKEEFEAAQPGLRGFGLFLVGFVLPCAAAAGIGYWVYTRWDGKFGRIRLGEQPSRSGLGSWDADQPWVKYPVAVAAGVVAVLAALPLLAGAAWRQVRSRLGGARRYTTRESFARGRGEYAIVDPMEDELLGGDEDEEF